MKCAFIHNRPNWWFKKNISFDEIKNISEYPQFGYHQMGLIYALESDILSYTTNLDTYDIVISFGPLSISKNNSSQLFLYIEEETPEYIRKISGRTWDILNESPVKGYDYLLNFFSDKTNNDRNIPVVWWYDDSYYLRNIIKNTFKIAIQKRTNAYTKNEFIYLKDNFWSGKDYNTFINELWECSYCINLDYENYFGQLTAECSMCDVITFSRAEKYSSKVLLPEYCYVTSVDEVYLKIEELNKDSEKKELILNQIRENRKKMSLDSCRTFFKDLYRKHLESIKK